jgi:transposase, IS30 family
MAYKRMSAEERRLIYQWRREGRGVREISKLLGRCASSISREVERNTGKRGYRPKQAHKKAQWRARRREARRFTDEVREDAERRLREGWTPEMICGRAKLEGRPSVCKETIYKYIYLDSKKGGDLWKQLPRAHRKRRRRCPKVDGRGRGRIPNQKMIDLRPPEVDLRQTVGHWEGDLINGSQGTGHLVTLVERKTRFTLTDRVFSKETEEVVESITDLFNPLPEVLKGTVTLDNGKEFARHEVLERDTGVAVYFARPYHSWERGTNENTNGLIRRLHPKRSSFLRIDDREIRRIDQFLNDRPRKCLGWRTPREEMAAFLVSAP